MANEGTSPGERFEYDFRCREFTRLGIARPSSPAS
jgi:hypothetical protein